MTLEEMKNKLQDIGDKMKTMNQLCVDEDRDFSEAEETEYSELEGSLDSVTTEIEAEETAAQERIDRAAKTKARQDKLSAGINRANNIVIPTPVIQAGEPEEFKSFSEFIEVIVKKVFWKIDDNRLAPLHCMTMNNPQPQTRAIQSMGEGTAGGYMLPTQFLPDWKEIAIQKSIIRAGADIIAPGDPPDSEVTFPALDQKDSITGGVTLHWEGEGDTKEATDFKLKLISLIPHEISGYIDVTDKLITNWKACASFVETRLNKALVVGEDTAFLTGNGVGKPKGISTQNCALTVTRLTAGSIVYTDLRKMLPYILAENGDNLIWLISPSGLESLMAQADPGTAGTLIWQPNAREGLPFSLLGYPIYVNHRSPALGTAGDLMLLNRSYYVIKDGSGPFFAVSPHVNFKSNQTCMRIVWHVDGDSWLQDKFPLEGDSTHFLSPFIILE